MAKKRGHFKRPSNSRKASMTSMTEKQALDPPPAYYLVHIRTVHTKHSNSLLSGRRRKLPIPETQRGPRMAEPSFTGFRHLILIILFLGNCRLIARDWRQFGWMSVLQQLGVSFKDLWWCAKLLLLNMLFWPIALIIELAAVPQARRARVAVSEQHKLIRKRKWTTICTLHLLNATTFLCLSSWLTYWYVWHPLLGTIVSCQAIISFLKLVSFFLTNRDLRDAYINNLVVDSLYSTAPYPSNLKLKPFIDYMLVPTLVYQPAYPRVGEIRWRVALALASEIILCTAALWLLCTQMAAPVLQHCLLHFRDDDTQGMLDDFLSLLTINIVIWLCMFLLIFQSMLNFSAELTRFADREFYADWWNAGSLGAYWRDWNRPISNYFRRHVYVPLRKQGYSMLVAQCIVFFFSAVGHELVVGVATKNFNGVAFLCMMAQIPLILATAPLERMRGPGTTIGNCIFWISVLFGQPTGVIIYYLSWQLRTGGPKSAIDVLTS